MSSLLDAIIEQRRQGALDYKKYLEQLITHAKKVGSKESDTIYPVWGVNGAQRAIVDFGWADPATPIQVDTAINASKPHEWVGNTFKEEEVARAIRLVLPADFDRFDELFELVKPEMSTASAYLKVSGIDVDVIYKNIKNLHIAVYPPLGRVRVAAPTRLDDDTVRLAVVQRLPWIKKQRQQLRVAVRQSEREMVTGESHYIWGRRYRLKVVERPGRTHFKIDGERLVLYTTSHSTAEQRRAALDLWHRQQLREAIPTFVDTWEQNFEVSVPKWTIRRMKTKWGSCNRETRHL